MEKYGVTVFEYVTKLRSYSKLRKLSVMEKWSLLADADWAKVPCIKEFYSKKDALKCYQESSKLYDKDFSPEKGYVAMFGIFMTHITKKGRTVPRQRISRPLSAKEMKVLEDLQND